MEKQAQWIWADCPVTWDQYVEFTEMFVGTQAHICISADSNYALYINDTLVHAGQYADFPYYKVYDEIDLSPYCRLGENRLYILVWYHGKSTMGYYPGKPALWYKVTSGDDLLCVSGAHTLSRICRGYANNRCQEISSQLGFGYRIDCTAQPEAYAPSRVVPQQLPLYPRPCKRPQILSPAPFTVLRSEPTHYLIDLLQETVGFLTIDMESSCEQEVLVAYGEHITDGGVRRRIGARDFSVELRLRPGRNTCTGPLRRLGLRYIEIFAEKPLQLHRATLLPCEYPLVRTDSSLLPRLTAQQRQIYEISLRTLHMCMHEHYEDTPWREQALYAMDSRNQILCGYYAFSEYAFPRANLLLMSKDQRPDELLSICTPSQNDLTIPSFSLHYCVEIAEYTRYSGDATLAREVFPKLCRVIRAFTSRLEGGLTPVFQEKCHWNFYEWAEGLDGALHAEDEKRYDAALQCLLVLALRAMAEIAQAIGEEDSFSSLACRIAAQAYATFFDQDASLLRNSTADGRHSELVNALAILSDTVTGLQAERIAATLTQPDNGLTAATLSMRCFLYDALLKVDRQKYRPWVLSDIDKRYSPMCAAGATTFWETEAGQADFAGAGSLCHGWSAMPVYYYHTLLEDEPCAVF